MLRSGRKMYGMVKNIITNKWPYFEVFVDEWPKYHAVLTRPILDKCDSFSGEYVLIHGNDPYAIMNILRQPSIFDWQKEYIFEIPPDIRDLLFTLLPDGSQLEELHRGCVFAVCRNAMKFSFEVQLPDIQVSLVKQKDVTDIFRNWNYIHPELYLFLTRLVNSKLPSICLRAKNGQLVAYAFVHMQNLIGMTYVRQDYRRKGLAMACISLLTKLLFEEEAFVAAHVNYDNKAFRNLLLSCGFVSLDGTNDYVILTYHPLKETT
ncbi:glycine N-acyltransferase-like protein 3 isoform X2 [Gigantopelta aegis]|uniref:glycine N-acyltransferase-like protein 3 isoform X2 n=1 Tax=Gigantopelta aegis TaxID=1735272 RepID=UPI001B88AB49|nr:glycine N-acyltransferase-like protein 3 isoform X2 [Gigantopelta aegis]